MFRYLINKNATYVDVTWQCKLIQRNSMQPQETETVLSKTISRTTLGSTQPPVHWVSGALSPGLKGPGRDTHRARSGAHPASYILGAGGSFPGVKMARA
jgi:hypothetical protein